jgi:hypothetical protein
VNPNVNANRADQVRPASAALLTARRDRNSLRVLLVKIGDSDYI